MLELYRFKFNIVGKYNVVHNYSELSVGAQLEHLLIKFILPSVRQDLSSCMLNNQLIIIITVEYVLR